MKFGIMQAKYSPCNTPELRARAGNGGEIGYQLSAISYRLSAIGYQLNGPMPALKICHPEGA
jgi:hypothetical protein